MINTDKLFTSSEIDPISRQVFAAIPAQLAVLNENGEVITHNQKWAEQHDALDDKWVFPLLGENVLKKLQEPLSQNDDYALRFMMAYKSVLSGENTSLKIHYPVKSEVKKWFSFTITVLEDKKHFLVTAKDITAEVSAKSTLNESSVRYQKQFQNKLYGILIADSKRIITDANKSACDLLGASLENIKGKPLEYFLNVDLKSKSNDVSHTGDFFLGESSINRFDGSPIPADLSVSKYTNYKGEEIFNCTFKDVSDRKKSENELKLSELRYKEQFENSLDGIIIAEQNGNIFDVNPKACQILGYKKNELVNETRDKLIDLKDSNITELIRTRDENKYYEGPFEFVHKDGSKVLVELRNRIVETESGIQHSILSFHDVSEHRKTERFYRKLFDASPNGIAVIDREGKVKDLNLSFSKIFGFCPEEIVEKKLSDFIVKEDDLIEAKTLLSKVLSGSDFSIETNRYDKDGNEIPVILSMFPIWEHDEITSVFCIYVDTTEQARSKSIIEKQLEEKEILIQEIHHRVKNNLAIISGLISLEDIYSKDQNLKNQLQITQSRIHSIAKIHELLYQNENFSSINFQEYIHDLAETFSRSSPFYFTSEASTPIHLNVNQAVPCGMLLHEITSRIVTKAKAQGFEKHTVYFNLIEEEEIISINICEKGKTSTFNFVEDHEDQLASELISVLVKQLNGKLELNANGETCISISFKKREKKGAHSAIL